MYYSKKLFRHPATRDAQLAPAKLTGGTPITADMAIELRKVIFGSAAAPPRGEWTRTPLLFGAAREDLAYGLRSPRNATRGLQSVLQAFVLKHLVFDQRPRDQRSGPIEQLLRPTEAQQTEALLSAMTEILWMVGERERVCVVLPGEVAHVAHSQSYFLDGVTEKLVLFWLSGLEEVKVHLKRYMHYFTDQTGAGALLFLYCAVMTRTPTKIITDLDAPKGAYLMGPHEEGSHNVVTLLLTGRATPYLHNGVVYVGDEDHYALPQFGILARASVGLLVLGTEAEIAIMQPCKIPGSRLKTPALPIWVTCCSNHFGVLFNSNRELLRNYHAEKRFELHYYTCAGCYLAMTVDNRTQDENPHGSTGLANGGAAIGASAGSVRVGAVNSSAVALSSRSADGLASTTASGSSSAGGSASASGSSNDIGAPPLERLIHTKWSEAKVTFKGPTPASLSY